MEKVNTLILKLQQQMEQKDTAEKLLITVQMLHAELSPQKMTLIPDEWGKVIVIMPGTFASAKQDDQTRYNVTESTEAVLQEEEKIIEVLQVDEKEIEAN